MSTQYAGLPGNESRALTLSVLDATNATPIEVQTTAAHGLQTGERVVIYGVVGNLATNGTFYVAVTDVDKFELYDSWVGGAVATPVAGSGAYVSGGTVAPQGWASTLQLPADGDAIDASSVNTATEGEGDREAWLVERTGAYRLIEVAHFTITVAGPGAFTIGAPGVIAATNGAWGDVAAINALIDAGYGVGVDVVPGDLIKIVCSGTNEVQSGGSMAFRLGYEFAEYGAAWTGAATGTIDRSAQGMGSATVSTYYPWSLIGDALPGVTNGGQIKPRLQDYGIGGAINYYLRGNLSFTVEVWRSNA
jgi:hypothetical protein